MSEYKRFSDRAIDIINELHKERLDYETEYIPLIDCANRLAELEDELESGMLIKPPCKVGDALYAIMDVDYEYTIVEFRARNIEIGEYGKFYINTPTGYSHRLTFGINVFTNKAQAEARLKELKGE